MKIWTTREAFQVKTWATLDPNARTPIQQLAESLRRTVKSVQDFLRRELGPGKLPWHEKPRWSHTVERSPEAVRKFTERHVHRSKKSRTTAKAFRWRMLRMILVSPERRFTG